MFGPNAPNGVQPICKDRDSKMITPAKPSKRPLSPYFSSGPTTKRPGFSLFSLETAALGRSHRSSTAKERLHRAIVRTREVLEVPDDYRIAIVPASDTGAVEMCMWSMLGKNPLDVFAWENFGNDWVIDTRDQLDLEDAKLHVADYGQLPDFSQARDNADIIFTWNGTTSGVRVPNADWLTPNPDRVVICDATSACFAQEIEWEKLDAVTYSWQKVLGGEAAHGMLILSPNAVRRLETFTPDRAVPKLFRMAKNGKLDENLFKGVTINTPSMLCVEDYLHCLDWAESLGGWTGLKQRSDESLKILENWASGMDWIEFLCSDPSVRSNTGVTFKFVAPNVSSLSVDEQWRFVSQITGFLEEENVAFDIAAYRTAPPGLRIWCGGTVEPSDVALLTPWIEWAYARASSQFFDK